MEVDYFEYVVAFYDKKMEENALSTKLVGLTPASLRALCLDNCQKEFSRKDQQILVDFFGPASDQSEMLARIKKIDIDKFKSLIRYLKKETSKTNLLNIELLAWLLDITDRPYNRNLDYTKKKEELSARPHTSLQAAVDESEPKDTIGKEIPSPQIAEPIGLIDVTLSKGKEKESRAKAAEVEKVSVRRQLSKVALLPLIVLVVGLVGFKFYEMFQQPQSCMYWTGDKYEAVSCNVKMQYALVIAYDSIKVHGFKRIVNTDTITYNSIGHIWYSKMNNNVEFYTASGRHPVQMHYQLRPITAHIIDVYVNKQ